MQRRWKRRPDGSNWGDFGPNDQRGRMNLITAQRRLAAIQEVKEGLAFCLSLPLDRPGGSVLNSRRRPPVFHPVMRDGHVHFNLALERSDPRLTDVSCDEAVLIYNQYSTQWDGLAHKGSLFDADGDGIKERVFYNGFHVVDDQTGRGIQGELGAVALSIDRMAETCVQGRGVLVDLHRHFGNDRIAIGYEQLMSVMQQDDVSVEEGDILCLHTGLGKLIMEAGDGPLDPSIRTASAVIDGRDHKLLDWITESGVSAIASDNLAVERSSTLGMPTELERGPSLPLHEHCLFKLGIHLGELWYLTELADWLRSRQRNKFLLTAPPLRMPGAAGSAVTPVATV